MYHLLSFGARRIHFWSSLSIFSLSFRFSVRHDALPPNPPLLTWQFWVDNSASASKTFSPSWEVCDNAGESKLSPGFGFSMTRWSNLSNFRVPPFKSWCPPTLTWKYSLYGIEKYNPSLLLSFFLSLFF